MKKCLLLLTGAFDSDGGIAALNRLTIAALAERYALELLVLAEREPKLDPRYLPDPSSVHARAFAGNKWKFVLSAWRALLIRNYDLVLVDHVNLASALAPWARLGLVKYAVWLCGMEVFPPRPDLEGRLGLQNASRRIAISAYTRQSVISRFPDLKIEICDLALDPARHVPLGSLEEEAEAVELESMDGSRLRLNRRVILHVGRMSTFERFKGQEILLDAFPLIHKKYPDAQLALAGKGDDLERLRGRALSLPNEFHSSIFMPGYVADDLLERLYRSCYLFAMPSLGEGFGLVYLEAMSRGKPCIGARADATPCVIRDRETGLLVDDPRSPEEVAGTILWLFDHPDEAKQMGRAGYELVRSHYLFPHFKERFWKALSS
jgi:glycosyltransferase involved in cell wall biosynthesis